MKKLILTSIIAACTALTASAQLPVPRVDLGIKAGFNYASLDGPSSISSESRNGLMFGAFLGVKVTDKFGVQVEGLFMQRGADISYTDVNNASSVTKARFNYFDIPVLITYKPVPFINFHAGPYASYLINVSLKEGTAGAQNTYNTITKSNFNDWDYGICAGVGFKALFISGGARYNLGLNKIANTTNANNFIDGRNRVVTLYLGWSFL